MTLGPEGTAHLLAAVTDGFFSSFSVFFFFFFFFRAVSVCAAHPALQNQLCVAYLQSEGEKHFIIIILQLPWPRGLPSISSHGSATSRFLAPLSSCSFADAY